VRAARRSVLALLDSGRAHRNSANDSFMRPLAPALLALAALLHASGATAEPRPQWEVGLGAAALYLPDYRGSDQTRGYVYPLPYVRYRGERLRMDDRRGLPSLLLLDTDRVELDVSLNASQPAPSDQSSARQGMPDLDPTLEIGPLVKVRLWESGDRRRELSLQLPVRAAFTLPSPEFIGWVFNPVIDLYQRNVGPGGEWRVGMQAGPVFTDRRYNEYYYQVDAQFATPARPAYSASGGYGGTQFTATASRRFGQVWVGGFVRAYALGGAAFEASPLVQSRSAFYAGIGFAYIFAESQTLVESDD
jgi:outer membrane scaffolding protein for murein synthesis (MipA/OmpV family)